MSKKQPWFAPSQPRFAYETVLQAPADMSVSELAADKLIRELSGTLPVFARPVFEKLLAIVARNGRVYVTYTSTESIVIFDAPRRRLFCFGKRAPNGLRKPVGLALDG